MSDRIRKVLLDFSGRMPLRYGILRWAGLAMDCKGFQSVKALVSG